MLIFESMGEAWQKLILDLLSARSQASRNGETREIIGYSFQITQPKFNWLCNKRRCLSPAYASAELLWYLSGEKTVERLLPYAPQYEKFIEDNGEAYGAYGPRILNFNQLERVKQILTAKQDSRQAVISIWQAGDLDAVLYRKVKDLPCTLNWQFLVRGGELHMVVNMRSNDAWLGTPYDVYCFTSIQKLLAGDLDLNVGTYTHNVGSMHLYAKHKKAAYEAAGEPPMVTIDGYKKQRTDYLRSALNDEAAYRTLEDRELPRIKGGKTALLTDSVICCASQFRDVEPGVLTSPSLTYALHIWREKTC